MRLIISILLGGMFLSCCPVRAEDMPAMRLSLKEALNRANQMDINVLVANARIEAALSQRQVASAALLPQVSATVNGFRQSKDMRTSGIALPIMPNYTGPFNTFDARARLTQTIFDPGTFERLKVARVSQSLSVTLAQKAREDAMALVAVLYIQAKRAAQEVAVMKVFVKRDAAIYRIVTTEHEQGTAMIIDLKQAKSDLLKSRYLLNTARTQAKERSIDLCAALQLAPGVEIIFDTDEDAALIARRDLNIPPRSMEALVAQEGMALAQSQVEAMRADNLPRVSLVGDYGRAGESPDKGSNTYTLGISATMPIWSGGSQKAKTAEANAKLKEAQAQYAYANYAYPAKVIEANENITKAQALIRAQAAQADLTHQQYALVRQQYSLGQAQYRDVLKAKSQALYDQDQYKEAVAVLWTSLINLAKAQGQMQSML